MRTVRVTYVVDYPVYAETVGDALTEAAPDIQMDLDRLHDQETEMGLNQTAVVDTIEFMLS